MTVNEPLSARSDEDMLRLRLRRFRLLAGALLGLMAAIAAGANWMVHHPGARGPHGGVFWWSLLAAGGTAGLVGGLADWFAVTALFRRPLGLPIPHTAIIPAQKARLGAALGRFVAHHVLTEADLARALTKVDLPGIVARTLREPGVQGSLERGAARLLPQLLEGMEDGRGRALLGAALRQALGGQAAGPIVARALRAMVESDRHQAVLTFLIDRLRGVLHEKEPVLRAFVETRVREQGGKLVGWALGSAVASRVLSALDEEVERLDPAGSELRAAVTQWLEAEITRIETDPARAGEIGGACSGLLNHPAMQGWLQGLWVRLRMAAAADAETGRPWIAGLVHEALERLSVMLAEDASLRARVDAAVLKTLRSVLPEAQVQVAGFIGQVVGNWDGQTISDRLELRVGRDLQYIRINGTVFGFVAGAALHLLFRLI